jgi:AraC-like DNA-binding protein
MWPTFPGAAPRAQLIFGRLQMSNDDQARAAGRWHDRAMTATADAFARFLDVLTDTLDDHAASAQALAERAHLSRFHFDRLVSAAAGEPPAALRRRILLERAAYQLITTDHDVIRVAIDAGYSSNEAFTRAFRRAYGLPPARWRRRPTGFRIDAPSRVHFNPPGGLRVPARERFTGMDLLTRMIEHHVWLVGEMLTRAERLPADQLSMPVQISVEGIDENPTLRSLLARLVGQLAMWDAAVHDRPYDFDAEQQESVARLQAKLAVVGPAFLAKVRTIIDDGRLDETFVDAVCDPPMVFTYGGMIAHVLTFAAHRRTLVCGALADAGITDLGAGDPMGWVAEHAA